MAARAYNVSVASGAVPVYMGRAAASLLWPGDVVVAGDSLTALSYPSAGHRYGFPLTCKPPRVIYNAGIANNTIKDLLDRWDADVTAKGAPIVDLRIGTNGPGTGTYQEQYMAIFDKIAAAGMKVIVRAVPPRGAGNAGVDSGFIAMNAWLEAYCSTRQSWMRFVQDSLALGDSNYNAIGEFYIESSTTRIHMSGKGVVAQGEAMAPLLPSILALTDPRISDPADIYPANAASKQWLQNPFNTGTAGTRYYATGVVPTGWNVSCNGVSSTGANCSIVAADVGDPVQTPWFRTELVQGVGNGSTTLTGALQHPAIDADYSVVKYVDAVVEVRLNAIDTTYVSSLTLSVQRGGVAANASLPMTIGGSGVKTACLVMRNSYARTLTAYPANTLSFVLNAVFGAGFSTSIGSIDIRCASVRGAAN